MLKSLISRLCSSQLRVNMTSGVVRTGVNIATFAISYPVYLHFLGLEVYGLWLMLAVVLALARLGMLGLNQAVMKLVAEEHGRNDVDAIAGYVTTALAALTLTGGAATALIVALRVPIAGALKLDAGMTAEALSLLPYIGLLSLYVFLVEAYNATLSGVGRMDLANLMQMFGRVSTLVVAVGFLLFDFGVYSLLAGNFFGYAVIHAGTFVGLKKVLNVPVFRPASVSAKHVRRLLSFGGGLSLGEIVNMMFSPFNKFILTRFVGLEVVPIYEVAYRGSMQIRAVLESALRAMLPEISRRSAEATAEATRRVFELLSRARKTIVGLALPLYLFLLALATPLLKLWLRGSYRPALPDVFRIILIGTFFHLLAIPDYYALLGLGKVRQCALAYALQAGVNCVIVLGVLAALGRTSVIAVAVGVALSMIATCCYLRWQSRITLRSGLAQGPETT